MDARQNNTLDSLKRAYVFVITTPLPAPLQNPSSGLSDQVAGLKAAIDAADAQATSQTSGIVQQTLDQRNALRASLRSAHLESILHVARVLEKSNPGLPKLVNMRSARSTQGLLNAAQAVLRDLPPYKDLLIARGLPADFLDQLQVAITAFENAGNATRQTKVARVQSRTGIDTELKAGKGYKQIISALIRRAAPSDPNGATFLRGWEAASHVRRDKGSSTSATGTTPATTGVAKTSTLPSSAVSDKTSTSIAAASTVSTVVSTAASPAAPTQAAA